MKYVLWHDENRKQNGGRQQAKNEGEAEEEAVRGSEGKRETESEVERDRL